MNAYQYAILRGGKQAEKRLQEVEISEEDRAEDLVVVACAYDVLVRLEQCRPQKTSECRPSAAATPTR